jgi:site-specific DNA-methyltransferase (adenine-specific)
MTHQIITGSCLDPEIGLPSLPDKSVDVCIADPPYEEQAHTAQRRVKNPGTGGQVCVEPLEFDKMSGEERRMVAIEIARVCGRALVFCQAEAITKWQRAFNAAGIPYRRAMPWVKTNASPNFSGQFPGQSWEAIIYAKHPSAPRPPCGGRAWYMRSNIDHPRFHQTEKPMELMRSIIRDFVNPGETIIDPYAGSGTTIVAAKMLGHDATGWELDPAMAEKARRRLNGCARMPSTGQTLMFG